MIKNDFEFVSTRRNRELWPNPCFFETSCSGIGQSTNLHSLDPVTNEAPIICWVGREFSIASFVVSVCDNVLVLLAPTLSFKLDKNYYQTAELLLVSGSSQDRRFQIESSLHLSTYLGNDYLSCVLRPNTNVNINAGDACVVQPRSGVPNTMFVPKGSDMVNAYTNKYLYNDSQHEFAVISEYLPEFRQITAQIPSSWGAADKFNIRSHLPSGKALIVGNDNTTSKVNIGNVLLVLGDFIRYPNTGEIVKIVGLSPDNFALVSPPFVAVLAKDSIVEILCQTFDNFQPLLYGSNALQEQTLYDIILTSGILPNVPIKNGSGGFPKDYPFLYVEFLDTYYPSQNILFSNNHRNKSYFKVTTPTGQLIDRKEKFTKFTGDLSHKTFRFRPSSNFRIVWRLPTGEEIKFEESDSKSPYSPKESLQTSVQFNLTREIF